MEKATNAAKIRGFSIMAEDGITLEGWTRVHVHKLARRQPCGSKLLEKKKSFVIPVRLL
jgi:hypothetical protein